MKFLIDECLSPELTVLARDRGYPESSHVVWIGKAGAKDWQLLPIILAGDWTFVTRNAFDFRGPPHAPGSKGQYRGTELHAGLICLNGPAGMDIDMQLELFEIALDELAGKGDPANEVLEVTLEKDSETEIIIRRYPLPPD
jgi:hypothetical protein